MKKAIIITSLLLSALMIFDSFNTVHELTMFLLIGIVPGTDIVLSANTMMALFAFLIGFIVSRIAIRYIAPLLAAVLTLKHKAQASQL